MCQSPDVQWRPGYEPKLLHLRVSIPVSSQLASRDGLGLVFDVRCSDPELTSYLDQLLVGFPSATGGAVAAAHFDIAPRPERGFRSVGQAVGTLISNINLGAIAAAAGNLLFHSGAVCDSAGQAALICGASGAGKSTLTARLVESGLAYLTDEVTCIDPIDLHLTPFRKPVSLKPGSQGLFAHLEERFDPTTRRFTDEVWLIPFTELSDTPLPTGPLMPHLLIFPTFVAGEELRVEPLSQGEAAFTLGENSSRLRMVSGGPLPALRRLVEQAPAYRIVHSDVHAAADRVRELLAA